RRSNGIATGFNKGVAICSLAVTRQADFLSGIGRYRADDVQSHARIRRRRNSGNDLFDLLEADGQLPDDGRGQHRKTADAGEDDDSPFLRLNVELRDVLHET